MAALSEQIDAFRRALPELRRDYGSTWAVLVDSRVRGAFSDFRAAAEFVQANFPLDEVLIRHTDEAPETVPFFIVES